jgi:hypothetical protein
MTDRLSNHGPEDMTDPALPVYELCVRMQGRLRRLARLARDLAWSVDAECDSSMEKAHRLMDFLKEDA